jgi:hypothetical protein
MKGFEKQIANAAQALRDEQNVGLTPPKLPGKNSASKAPVFAWWTRVAVAACVGYIIGIFTFPSNGDGEKDAAQTARVETIYDTVYHTVRDTIYQIRTMPAPLKQSGEQMAHRVSAEESIPQMAQSCSLTEYDTTGMNILADTINYSLLVSL